MSSHIERRKTESVRVGPLFIGSDHPIAVQSMTNTKTADVEATVAQILALVDAGSELVRITVDTHAAAKAVTLIIAELERLGVKVPICGDFHFNAHTLLVKFPDMARALAKWRINPGNVGFGQRRDKNFRTIVELAILYDKPIRIGVNWGSLDKELKARLMDENSMLPVPLSDREVVIAAMVESAMASAQFAEEVGLPRNHIIISAKMSDVSDVCEVYRRLAPLSTYPFHVGLTEAGMEPGGIVGSSLALGILLSQGIGDTIRVSLTPPPDGDRTEEVRICQLILQKLGIRSFTPQVAACPGCGRTSNDFYQKLALRVDQHLAAVRPKWRKLYPGFETLTIAVMGCRVNGPGEAGEAMVAITLPGDSEKPVCTVYIKGEPFTTLTGDDIGDQFVAILDDYVASEWGNS